MRIVQLTAGTGSYYCGTCLRDNALVVELRKMGHDATMVPLYLPPVLDEEPANENTPLFYGGINVFLQQKSSLFRKTPRWIDQWLDSPRLLQTIASRAGSTSADQLGDLTVSTLKGEEGHQIKELDRLVAWLAEGGRPDIVCLSNALLIGLTQRIKDRTSARVVCTLQGEDSFLDSLPESHREDAWKTLVDRAKDVDAFVAISKYYGDVMQKRMNLPKNKVHIVYNGILLDGYGPTSSTPDPPALGYLARMCPPKGLETLVDAYLILQARNRIKNLRLRVAGSCTSSDAPFVDRLRNRIADMGFGSDAAFLKNISRDQKIAFLKGLSVLSVPATYGEAFGLYVIESLAAGVPVVQPRHAAFPELIEATGGGLLCEPDNPESLAQTIEHLLSHPDEARAMGEKGRQVVNKDFSVEKMAINVFRVFEKTRYVSQ